MEGGPKPQLPVVIIIIVISYTSLSRNQVVLLVDLSNMYLYPDNELIIMRLNHVKYVYAVFDSITVLYCIHRLIVLLFPFIISKFFPSLFFKCNFPHLKCVEIKIQPKKYALVV